MKSTRKQKLMHGGSGGGRVLADPVAGARELAGRSKIWIDASASGRGCRWRLGWREAAAVACGSGARGSRRGQASRAAASGRRGRLLDSEEAVGRRGGATDLVGSSRPHGGSHRIRGRGRRCRPGRRGGSGSRGRLRAQRSVAPAAASEAERSSGGGSSLVRR
ncbi:hypothetical protein BRADI_3g44235v3 [Brachypodium distachyon]|uniref:Uncharacterized protein n=1 Tax=Brachypodium distachyon TaxID=15368 RepID=A0A0Q3M504_BRADI|nr:hypothetical protein BRADI_3g44235v3 [Brachypodium distachyon]